MVSYFYKNTTILLKRQRVHDKKFLIVVGVLKQDSHRIFFELAKY